MIQAVTVSAGDRALDVAGGSGYGAAILAAMGAKVVLLESDAGAAGQVASGRASRFTMLDRKRDDGQPSSHGVSRRRTWPTVRRP